MQGKQQEFLIDLLKERYEKMAPEIKARLDDFKQVGQGSHEQLFEELAFCLCTPQSKARAGDLAVRRLKAKDLLFKGTAEQVGLVLLKSGVRFPREKGKRIVEARTSFDSSVLEGVPEQQAREWLLKNIKGLGMKEASHYLRNLGKGSSLAILDRHILKNLLRYGVISQIPQTLSNKAYLEIEGKLKEFSLRIGIPLDAVDLLFWSAETGEVFK